MSEAELAEALRPVVGLGNADPRVGAFFVELSTLRLDRTLWPSLPASSAVAVSLASEAIVRVDDHFMADCALLEGLGRAPPRTVLELALRVDDSHGSPLGAAAVEAQPLERKSLSWELARANDEFLGLQAPGEEGAPPGNPEGGDHGRGGAHGGEGGGEGETGSGTVPGDDRVVSTLESPVPRGLQLLVAFRGAQRARAAFPAPASQTAVWRYLPHEQDAFSWLLARLGAATSGAARVGPEGGRVCGEASLAAACIQLGAGALASPVLIRLEEGLPAAGLQGPLAPVGPPIRLSPDGLALGAPATLTLPTSPALARTALLAVAGARAYSLAAGAASWVEVPGSIVEPAGTSLQVSLAHFSFRRRSCPAERQWGWSMWRR